MNTDPKSPKPVKQIDVSDWYIIREPVSAELEHSPKTPEEIQALRDEFFLPPDRFGGRARRHLAGEDDGEAQS